MALYRPGSSSKSGPPGPTEFEILKSSHKFLREDDEQDKTLSWEEQVAQKYYASLYREYAVCDLKHYKSGNFALRWRTEAEVISGAGETTCGNTRCPLHSSRNIDPDDPGCALKTLELPFSYVEDNESKFALVKVVLCDRCCKKLMWKRNKEKERERETQTVSGDAGRPEAGDVGRTGGDRGGRQDGFSTEMGESSRGIGERGRRENGVAADEDDVPESSRRPRRHGKEPREKHHERRSRRQSRSRSPRRREAEGVQSRRRNSPS